MKTDKYTTRFGWLNAESDENIRNDAACMLDDKYFDEFFTVETAPIECLRMMLEDEIITNWEYYHPGQPMPA